MIWDCKNKFLELKEEETKTLLFTSKTWSGRFSLFIASDIASSIVIESLKVNDVEQLLTPLNGRIFSELSTRYPQFFCGPSQTLESSVEVTISNISRVEIHRSNMISIVGEAIDTQRELPYLR